jgi:hypothetical protein
MGRLWLLLLLLLLLLIVPGAPVQPVAIKHDHCWFDLTMTENKSYYLWRFLTQFYNKMSVEFLPVVTPTSEEQNNPKLFAERVRTSIADALGVSKTEHALADFFLSKTAAKGGTEMYGTHHRTMLLLHYCSFTFTAQS